MMFATLLTILSLCVAPTFSDGKSDPRPGPPANFQPTSYVPYMDFLVGKVNMLLGLKVDEKGGVSKSFFKEVYKIMEQGNNTKTGLTRGCVEGILDLVWPFEHLLKRRGQASLDEAAMYFQWKKLGPMLDSWGKPGAGITEGNTKWLGSYQQCKRLKVTKPCLLVFDYRELPESIEHPTQWGICVPKQCTLDDVETFMNFLMEQSNYKIVFLEKYCEEPTRYTRGQLSALSLLATLVLLSVLGALVDWWFSNEEVSVDVKAGSDQQQEIDYKSTEASTMDSNNTVNKKIVNKKIVDKNNNVNRNLTEKVEDEPSRQPAHLKRNILVEVLSSFSIIKSCQEMMNMDVHPDSVENMNGVRFFSTAMVTAGHTYIYIFTDDLYLFSKTMTRYWFMVVANAPAIVDLFFLMSGCLAAYMTMKWKQKSNRKLNLWNILLIYLHRIVRLTPTVGMVIVINTFIVPLVLVGPKAVRIIHLEEQMGYCKKWWWTNILYINNIYPRQNQNCVSWTWYLPNDMQMFLCSPFLLLIFLYISRKTSRKILGPFLVTLILLVVSIGVRFYLLYKYNLPGASLFNYSRKQAKQRDYDAYWDRLYVKPWARYAPYLIGMFIGYVLAVEKKVERREVQKNRKLVTVCWIVALLLGWYSIFSPFQAFSTREFSDFNHLQYGTFYNTAIAAAFGWLIYACHNNMGGVLNSFLSWPGWIPVARISYGAYVFHPIVCQYYLNVQENHVTLVETLMPILLTGIIGVSYLLGAINFLLVEYPAAKLEKMLLSR